VSRDDAWAPGFLVGWAYEGTSGGTQVDGEALQYVHCEWSDDQHGYGMAGMCMISLW
jgi:hypothetical protein